MGIISGPTCVPVRGRPSKSFEEKLKQPVSGENDCEDKVSEKEPKEFKKGSGELITSSNIMIHKFKCMSGDKDFISGRTLASKRYVRMSWIFQEKVFCFKVQRFRKQKRNLRRASFLPDAGCFFDQI